MNRFILFLTLLGLQSAIALNSISENAQQWEKLKEEIGNDKNSTIVDKKDLINEYENDFWRLINHPHFSLQQRNIAFALQCKCSQEMLNRLNTLFYTDKSSIDRNLQKQRAECIAKIAQIKAEYYYEQYIIQKNQVYDKNFQQKLGKETYDLTFKTAQNKIPESLSYLINGELEKYLAKEIDSSFHKKEIFEIYPHEKSPNHQTTLNKISNGRHFRGVDCCICSNSFEEIGKRVNLPCGHDICPDCLQKNLHENKRRECPQCRQSVTEVDFPLNYLKEQKLKK